MRLKHINTCSSRLRTLCARTFPDWRERRKNVTQHSRRKVMCTRQNAQSLPACSPLFLEGWGRVACHGSGLHLGEDWEEHRLQGVLLRTPAFTIKQQRFWHYIPDDKKITCTSHGSIIPNEPGRNSPDERSWKARLKMEKKHINVMNT